MGHRANVLSIPRRTRGTVQRTVVSFIALAMTLGTSAQAQSQRYRDATGKLRVALAQQPFLPNGTSRGPATMANGGIQQSLEQLGAVVRLSEAALTAQQDTE